MVRVARPPRDGFCRALRLHCDEPCKIYWDLDAMGFCKYHSPLAFQCRATARETGKRCNVRWNLDADLLCEYHPGHRVACHAVNHDTGKRCGRVKAIDRHGSCATHVTRLEDLAREFIWRTMYHSVPGPAPVEEPKIEPEPLKTEPSEGTEVPQDPQDGPDSMKMEIVVKVEPEPAAVGA